MRRKKLFFGQILLAAVLGLALVFRLYRVDKPVADWHSWRQADTAAVTRNFVTEGIDFFHPKFDDLSSVASGRPNPEGYRFVEFPIYNAISAFWVKFLPSIFTVEISSRIVSIFCSLASCALIFLIGKRYLGLTVGLGAAFLFAVLPYSVYYSRAILPEPMMVMVSLGMIWFFDQWIEQKPKTKKLASRDSFGIQKPKTLAYILAVVFATVGLLLKPFVAFLFLPLVYLICRRLGLRGFFNPSTLLFFSFSVLPFVLWRWWVSHFPPGIPAYQWLLNQDQIRFKGAFFYWLFAKRLGELILGFWGMIPLGLGLVLKPGKKEGWFFHFWLLAILVYFSFFATGNVRHDYYQIISLPIICIFLAKGFHFLLFGAGEVFHPIIGFLVSVVCLLFGLAFSWYQIRTYYWINKPAIIVAGQAIDRLVAPEAKVIAPYQGDTAFLYQTKRKGWPVVEAPLEEMHDWGADYLVSVDPQDLGIQGLKKRYQVLEETGEYIIFDLAKPL
jgi:4-amino-4-deoxy-L-arabinose transferase-like glycosyltransferase